MNSYVTTPTQPQSAKTTSDPAANPYAVKLVDSVSELAVLPHVVFKVLDISGSTDNPADELEKAIIIDPAFSTKLLAHANSSFYSLARKVTSIRDALVYLGFKEVRQMAMTIGVFDMFVGKNDKNSLRRRAWWRESLDTAIACRYIAESSGHIDPSEAYTCGLLHCIGKTLLDRFGEADYAAVEQRIAVGSSEKDAEKRVYGCDHEMVAVLAGKKWGLSSQLIASFEYSDELEKSHSYPQYRACVAMGTMIAKLAIVGARDIDLLPFWAADELGFSHESIPALYDHAVEHIAASGGMSF